jgi:hypothetical membrane protein
MRFDMLHITGYAGTGLILLAILCPALVYRGNRGERFSLLNHFISELGEVGVSRAAWLFNSGLFLGGLILLPYLISLGISFGSFLGWLGTAVGIIAVLGVAAVGIFPMNNLKPHTIAALTYFRSGLLMVFFYGLAIIFQPGGSASIPQGANGLSLLAFLAYGAFLVFPMVSKRVKDPEDMLDPEQMPERPRVSPLAALEWLVFFSTILWLLGMTFFVS